MSYINIKQIKDESFESQVINKLKKLNKITDDLLMPEYPKRKSNFNERIQILTPNRFFIKKFENYQKEPNRKEINQT